MRKLLLLVVLFLARLAPARGGGGCVSGGTLVDTPTGPVAVERLNVGDAVLTGTGVARVQAADPVEPDQFVRIDVGDKSVCLTPEHPVAGPGGRFVRAGDLTNGDVVVTRGGPLPVRSVTRLKADRPAYNLTVWPDETFFAAGILVHNKGCFLPDTPVLRPDGSSTLISSLRAGDAVLAFDEQSRLVPATIREVIAVEADGYLSVSTDRVTLSVTAEHPFYVGGGRYQTAGSLHAGDRLFAFDGDRLSPQTVRSIRAVPGKVTVYNLHTDDPHTFFAAGIAVHNKGGGGGGGGHGGGGFGGGSHSWGGSTGGGSGSSGWCCLVFAIVGIPLYIFSIVRKATGAGRGGGTAGSGGIELDYVHPQAVIRPRAESTERLLASMARFDPAIEPGKLRLAVRDTFVLLQQCWESRNYEPMRSLLTPELFAQHLRQLAAMRQHHETNRIADLRVESVDFVHVVKDSRTGEVDVTALVTAAARDFYVDDRTGNFLRGDRSAARFQEFWTFHESNRRWLLRQIEQSGESRKLSEPNDVGVAGGDEASGPVGPWTDRSVATSAQETTAAMREWARSDPGWDPRTLVDRVGSVFAAAMLARQGDGQTPATLEDATASLIEEANSAVRQDRADGLRREYRNFDVRHVDLLAANRSPDRLLARVAAHTQEVIFRNNQITGGDPDVRAFVRFAVLVRSDGRWVIDKVNNDPSGWDKA